jgi:hypothetical protein
MCVYYVLQIIFIIMKNLLGNFKVKESSVNSVEFLNENEMQQIRGGVEVPRPSSRPREIFDETEL